MKTLQQSWHHSAAAALALAVTLNSGQPAALADEPSKPEPQRSAPATSAAKPSDPAKRSALKAKLERIVLPEVAYDSIPLGEVVHQLIAESARRDPDRTGVNFLFSTPRESAVAAIDPATGLPVRGEAEFVEPKSITVRIVPPLKNVRLIDVLDAITKVADRPVKYSIQDYAVILSLAPPNGDMELALMSVRTFHVNTNSFFASAEKTFGVAVSSDSSARQQDDLRLFLTKIGVNMDSPHKSVFYNEQTGILMVRAAPSDLDLVQAAISTLGGTAEIAAVTPPSAVNHLPGAGIEDTVSKLIQAIGNAIPAGKK